MENKKINILIFSWRGPGHPHAGGAEIVTHEHAKAWVKQGYKVTLFTSGYEDCQKEETIDGVKIIRRGSQILSVQFWAFVWYLFIQKDNFDLVVDQFHGLPFFTPLFVKRKKLAFIHEVTKDVWRYNPLKEPFHSIVSKIGQIGEPLLFRYLYRNIPFLTVSESTKKDLVDYGISSKLITIIHNGFYPVKRALKRKKKVITFIGAIAEDKGIEDAIKVFNLLKQTSFDFWVIGKHDSVYFEKVQQLVDKYKLESRVTFWGFVSESKKFDLLNESYLVVNPSVREGWGLTVIEAAAVYTPTVAYKVSGLQDAIKHPETGLLVERKTPQQLSKAIKMLIKDKKIYKSLQLAGFKRSKKFNWKDATKQSLRLIQEIIN
jgi:glycosyltransferase involved in cell wall biosynthesis